MLFSRSYFRITCQTRHTSGCYYDCTQMKRTSYVNDVDIENIIKLKGFCSKKSELYVCRHSSKNNTNTTRII